MALELLGAGRRLSLAHQPSVFALGRLYALDCPELARLEGATQTPYEPSRDELQQLLLELEAVMIRYQRERRAELQRENHIYSRYAQEVEAILSGLMAADETVNHLARVVEFCVAALHDPALLRSEFVEDAPVADEAAVVADAADEGGARRPS